jgi:hypothetical protein
LSSNKDILTKEIESWKGFEYALRQENRLLFHKMLGGCRSSGYADCVKGKGQNSSAESLFLILILHQQKMINELITKLHDIKNQKVRIT